MYIEKKESFLFVIANFINRRRRSDCFCLVLRLRLLLANLPLTGLTVNYLTNHNLYV